MKQAPDHSLGFATRAIHHGYNCADQQGALTPPVYMTSTFAFDSAEQGGAVFAGEQPGHFYSRISNPTLDLLEQRMASLEGGQAAVAFASGMGAICSTLWTLLKQGDELLIDKTLYGCTFAFMRSGLSKFGVKIIPVDMTEPDRVSAAITDKTQVIYFETPANPNMRLVDISAISKIAHDNNTLTVVDNTYATPYLTRPLTLGADVVVHSATKYLGGHGDLIAGIAVGSNQIMQDIRLEGLKDLTGAVMSPMTAFHLMRGLKTLELRMDRHCRNALQLAEMLNQHPAVAQVYYPGLPDFDQYQLALQQMAKPGGMIAFELHGGMQAGIHLMNQLQLIKRAVSLGDAETLIQHPASMTHSTSTPEERASQGISDSLVRLSAGLECCDDLIEDLKMSLEHLLLLTQVA